MPYWLADAFSDAMRRLWEKPGSLDYAFGLSHMLPAAGAKATSKRQQHKDALLIFNKVIALMHPKAYSDNPEEEALSEEAALQRVLGETGLSYSPRKARNMFDAICTQQRRMLEARSLGVRDTTK